MRHQLPVFSPLPLAAIPGAAVRALVGRDPAAALAERLRRELEARQVVLVGSGTEALQLAIAGAAAAVGGDPVVALPGFSCFDVAAAAAATGRRLALYDVDPDTLAPDPDSLEAAFRAGARVAVVGPLYGVPIDWATVERLAARHGALLVEDAAQGHGASWAGRPLGSHGVASVLSFGRGKGWTGSGGGALLLRGELLPPPGALAAEGVSGSARVLATALAQGVLGRPALYGVPASIPWLGLGETHYHPARAPRHMAAASAALLARTRELSRREAEHRRANAAAYLHELEGVAGVQPIRAPEGAEAGFLRLPVRLARGMDGFPSQPRALRLGIAPSYPSTLAALPAMRAQLASSPAPLPGAERLVRELVTLPTHSRVTAAERAEIVGLLRHHFGEEQ